MYFLTEWEGRMANICVEVMTYIRTERSNIRAPL